MPPTDGELIDKFAQNDQLAFDQLFFKYKSSVYRFAFYLTQNKNEADDLFQETWLRAVKNMNQNKKIKDFKAWIFTIANNLHRDELRRKKIRRLFFSSRKVESNVSVDSENDFGQEITTNKNGSSHNIEFNMAFKQAVTNLSFKQRRVFVLQEIEGFKQKEISKMLNIPIGTVKSLFYRAIKFLQKELVEFQTN
jgi:RNA polymerase sigma-70 factor (ECF subfamily)